MVTAMGAVWLRAPDVPVTLTLTWAICAFGLFELPPQPRVNIETSSSNPRALVQKTPRVSRFTFRARAVPNKPKPGSNPTPIKPYPVTGGGAAAAVTVKVDDAALDPGEIVVGLNAQVTPAGAVQVSEISPLNPPTALALTIKVAEPPAATVALWAERFSEKLGLPAAVAGTRLANTAVVLPPEGKLGWLPPPAVM